MVIFFVVEDVIQIFRSNIKCFEYLNRLGNIGANYQSLGKKFLLCFLDSHVIGLTETTR